jgi:hypothetical protein
MDIPQFMNIGEFCRYTGLSRWHFMRICDRYHVPLRPRGGSKSLEVEPTIKVLATVPGIEYLMSDRGLELVRPHLQEAQESQDDYLSAE